MSSKQNVNKMRTNRSFLLFLAAFGICEVALVMYAPLALDVRVWTSLKLLSLPAAVAALYCGFVSLRNSEFSLKSILAHRGMAVRPAQNEHDENIASQKKVQNFR